MGELSDAGNELWAGALFAGALICWLVNCDRSLVSGEQLFYFSNSLYDLPNRDEVRIKKQMEWSDGLLKFKLHHSMAQFFDQVFLLNCRSISSAVDDSSRYFLWLIFLQRSLTRAGIFDGCSTTDVRRYCQWCYFFLPRRSSKPRKAARYWTFRLTSPAWMAYSPAF